MRPTFNRKTVSGKPIWGTHRIDDDEANKLVEAYYLLYEVLGASESVIDFYGDHLDVIELAGVIELIQDRRR